MWIFSRYGFFSVVNKLDEGQPQDRPLQIRSRWTNHLQRLGEAFPHLAKPVKVDRASDYAPERIYASADDFAKVLDGMARKIDYGNFKGFMDRDRMFGMDGFAHALHEVWSVVYRAYNRAFKEKR
jgi:hypothetical protein